MTEAEIVEREFLRKCFRFDEHNTNNKHAVNFFSAWILDPNENGSFTARKSNENNIVKIELLPIKTVEHWKLIYKRV